MMRMIKMTVLLAGCCGVFVLPSAQASPVSKAGAISRVMPEDFSAQSRRYYRRAPPRVRIYRGSSYLGPNAVRVCNAYYEQEYRPSGTVIVPRMRCHWRG